MEKTCLVLLGNDGAACPLMLYPDGSYISTYFWGVTEDFCNSNCLIYNSARMSRLDLPTVLLGFFLLLRTF